MMRDRSHPRLDSKSRMLSSVSGLVGLALALVVGCSDGQADNQTAAGGATSAGGMGGTAGTTVSTGGAAGNAGAGPTGGASTSGGSSGAGVGGASAGSGVGGSSSGGAMPGGSPATGGTSSTTGGAGGSSAGAAGASAGSGGSGGSAGAAILDQTGNFIYEQLETYKGWLSTASGDAAKLTADRTLADNMLTWQMPHGGFDKRGVAGYASPWNGSAPRSGWTGANGVEIGTLDNDATVTEIMFLADVYKRSAGSTYRDGARRALDFVLTMQFPSGGFPQVYPARANVDYSNYVTFNDDAMARALVLLLQITEASAAARRRPLHCRPAHPSRDRDHQGRRLHPRRADRPGRREDRVVRAARSHLVHADGRPLLRACFEERQGVDRRHRFPDDAAPNARDRRGRACRHRLVQERRRANERHRVREPPLEQHRRQLQPHPVEPGSTMWYRFYDLDQTAASSAAACRPTTRRARASNTTSWISRPSAATATSGAAPTARGSSCTRTRRLLKPSPPPRTLVLRQVRERDGVLEGAGFERHIGRGHAGRIGVEGDVGQRVRGWRAAVGERARVFGLLGKESPSCRSCRAPRRAFPPVVYQALMPIETKPVMLVPPLSLEKSKVEALPSSRV